MFRKILGISLLLLAAPAFAGDLSYNYVQFGYQIVEFDDDFGSGIDVDGDGLGISGSFEIAENWFIGAGYAKSDFDFGIDLDQLSAGVGYHTAISERADVFATLSFIRAEVSAGPFGSVDEDGFGMSVGIRGLATDQVELFASIGYVDLGDGADGTSFGVGGLYSFTEKFAIGLNLETDEDVTAYGIGARLYF